MEKLLTILFLVTGSVLAQIPTEQDCLGALPICSNYYHVKNSYSGQGNIPEEIPKGFNLGDYYILRSCLEIGEFNSVWYKFKVLHDDTLSFTITPNNMSDDYDWGVYDLTSYECKDIINDSLWYKLEIACNFKHPSGYTGLNYLEGEQNQLPIQLKARHNYVLYISNFSASPFGYSLSISLGRKNPIVLPTANFIASPQPTNTRASEITFKDKSDKAVKWYWTFYDKRFNYEIESKDFLYLYEDSGIYNVKLVVEDINGCKDTIIKQVIIDPEYAIYIPNSFTPNNDGLNDRFEVIATGIEDYYIEIYDRRGIIVFKSRDLTNTWTCKNCETGVYTYIVTYKISKKLNKKETKELIMGIINLINE